MAKNKIDYDVIVIGGSAGSVDVLMKIVPQLPEDYPLVVIVVIHRKVIDNDLLLSLLQSKSKIKVKEAESNEKIEPCCVYLAPADYHLLMESDKTFTLDFSEKVMYSRPSIDVTMYFAAQVYKNKLVGILLTGANEDGAKGMRDIKNRGGYTIVQDLSSSTAKIMPEAAIKLVEPDEVLNVENIIKTIININTKI